MKKIKHETFKGKNPAKGWTDVGYSSSGNPLRKDKDKAWKYQVEQRLEGQNNRLLVIEELLAI